MEERKEKKVKGARVKPRSMKEEKSNSDGQGVKQIKTLEKRRARACSS